MFRGGPNQIVNSIVFIFCLEYTAHSSLYDEIKHQIGVFFIIKDKRSMSDSIVH